MADPISDLELERLVLAHGRVTAEELAQYKARAKIPPVQSLYQLLLDEGVLTQQMLDQIQQGMPSGVSGMSSFGGSGIGFGGPGATMSLRRGARRVFEGGARAEFQDKLKNISEHARGTERISGPQPVSPQSAPDFPTPSRGTTIAIVRKNNTQQLVAESDGADWPGGIAPDDSSAGHIQDYLKKARTAGASDLHMSVGMPPLIRAHGQFRPLIPKHPPLKPEDTVRMIKSMVAPKTWTEFAQKRELDFCYFFLSGGRFRCNSLKQRLGHDLICRVIGERVHTVEELGLPPQCSRLTEYNSGLVLIAGPTGSGKTNTMMSLAQIVNETRNDHIVTIEDPIEYILQPRMCQVTQRQVGRHSESFSLALRAALREDPDVIVVGELRDIETAWLAITAAETGHLVFASLPTQDACKTMDKLINFFAPDEQVQIRQMVSTSLRGIIAQQLVPRKDGTGRVAAVELLFNNIGSASLIKDGNTLGLLNIMQLGKKLGMLTMDESLAELLGRDLITAEEAYGRAVNKTGFEKHLAAQSGRNTSAVPRPTSQVPTAAS